jgi:uncharacterized membrane protein
MAGTETRRRSITKTISWRAVASLTTAIIAVVAMMLVEPDSTGSTLGTAGVIGAMEVPSKLLLYYLHERVWAGIRWGLA